jgi:hypothetical protein
MIVSCMLNICCLLIVRYCVASGRYQLQEADFTNKSDGATVVNFMASPENKIVLIFRHKTKCATPWVRLLLLHK